MKILKKMKLGKTFKEYFDEGFTLNVGQNTIEVVDETGKTIRRRVVTFTGDESKVQKSMQDETDIKNILKKYGRSGMLPVMKNPGMYGDFSEVPDYQEALSIINKAEQQFSSLDADLRKRFKNDPAQFLKFCTDEKNIEEMYELGLAVKPVNPNEKADYIIKGISNTLSTKE